MALMVANKGSTGHQSKHIPSVNGREVPHIADWEEANNASCVINTDYKILWVVNSENYIYKRNALNRAKQVRERNIYQENCLPYFLLFRLTPACAPGSTRLGISGTWSGPVST